MKALVTAASVVAATLLAAPIASADPVDAAYTVPDNPHAGVGVICSNRGIITPSPYAAPIGISAQRYNADDPDCHDGFDSGNGPIVPPGVTPGDPDDPR